MPFKVSPSIQSNPTSFLFVLIDAGVLGNVLLFHFISKIYNSHHAECKHDFGLNVYIMSIFILHQPAARKTTLMHTFAAVWDPEHGITALHGDHHLPTPVPYARFPESASTSQGGIEDAVEFHTADDCRLQRTPFITELRPFHLRRVCFSD